MAQINVGEQLRTDGQAIQAMASTFQGILDKGYSLVDAIDAGWEGLSNNAFMADYQRIKTTLQNLPDTITNLGKGAVSAADAYEQTDVSGAKR